MDFFLEEIDEMSLIFKYRAFTHLIEVAKETGLIRKHLGVILEIFPLLPEISKLLKQNQIDAFSKLIDVIDGTDLENESAFKEWKDLYLDFDKEVY